MPRSTGKLYIAFATIEWKRNQQTLGPRYPALAEEPGLAHALDVSNTRDGDPWWRMERMSRGQRVRREPHFYEGVRPGPAAACEHPVRVVMPQEFNPEDPDACPDCAELARSGEAIGRWRRPTYRPSGCGEYLRLEEDGEVTVIACHLRYAHDGNHRGPGGEWLVGVEDFIPPPDGYV